MIYGITSLQDYQARRSPEAVPFKNAPPKECQYSEDMDVMVHKFPFTKTVCACGELSQLKLKESYAKAREDYRVAPNYCFGRRST